MSNSFAFVCAVCGKTAGDLSIVTGCASAGGEQRKALVVRSFICEWQRELAGPEVEEFSRLLQERDAAGLFARNIELVPFYCLECDKIYCRDHWECAPAYDDGFYDCTKGTCPKGHTRTMDD